jgi:hypothetical protein
MRILSVLAVPVGIICIAACPSANAANTASAGGKCSPNGLISTSGPNGTGTALTCENGAWSGPPTAYGTATISLRSGRVTHSSVIGLGGEPAPWAIFTEVPYIASVLSAPGKKPVKTTAFIHDGVSGAIGAVGQRNGHVALKIDLVDTTLVEMGHSTATNGETIDTPKTNSVELHGTIDLADGQSAPLVAGGKTIGTVSWSAIKPRQST